VGDGDDDREERWVPLGVPVTLWLWLWQTGLVV
jgi:hypothetical protein